MTTETNKNIVRRFFMDVLTEGKMDVLEDILRLIAHTLTEESSNTQHVLISQTTLAKLAKSSLRPK